MAGLLGSRGSGGNEGYAVLLSVCCFASGMQQQWLTAAAARAAKAAPAFTAPCPVTDTRRPSPRPRPAARSGANLMGYLKCSKAAQSQIKGKFNSLFTSGLKAYMFGRS